MKQCLSLAAVLGGLVLISACSPASDLFSIEGDFSTDGQIDLTGAHIEIYSWVNDFTIATATIKDNSFSLSGVLQDDLPNIADVQVVTSDGEYIASEMMILEGGQSYSVMVRYVIETEDSPIVRLTVNGTGRHDRLISSWRNTDEYVTKAKSMSLLFREQQALPFSNDDRVREWMTAPGGPDTEHGQVLNWDDMSCSDYSGDFVSFQDRDRRRFENLEQTELSQQLNQIRSEVLQEVVDNSKDPIDILLATELGGLALGTSADEIKIEMDLLESLVDVFDSHVVESRISPRLSVLESWYAILKADEKLDLGTYMEDFELPNLQGELTSLESVLEEDQIEVVLIDFWSIWCRRCIRANDYYKLLYSVFADRGFEIIGVSLNDDSSEWVRTVRQRSWPWVNVNSTKGFEDPVISEGLGVLYLPKNFLVDRDGCILKRDLRPNEVRDFLNARLPE